MQNLVSVAVHSSAFPENVRRDLLQSLRRRKVNPKFHYISYKQSEKWLALHEAYSPARTDSDCAAIYDEAFHAAAKTIPPGRLRLIGLGCGGGQKDARILSILARKAGDLSYVPCDVSLPLVLTSTKVIRAVAGNIPCEPLVCDLAGAGDLKSVFTAPTEPEPRLYSFFGMIPNFEPEEILPKLASLIGAEDWLLFSANLAPGPDYAAGVEQVFPGYDNPLTRDWLMAFLLDLGVESTDGTIHFSIETSPAGFKRIVADFIFSTPRTLRVEGETFEFGNGEKIRLFFSYRYTVELMEKLLSAHGLSIITRSIAKSGEEGVFFCRRAGARTP